jgi:hypothetical protein
VERECAKGLGWLELGFDDLRDCRDIKDIVGGMIGDIPRSIEDSAENFGLETGCVGCWQAWLNPTTQRHKSTSASGWLCRDIQFVSKGQL